MVLAAILALVFLFGAIVALHVVVIACVTAFYLFSPHSVRVFESPLVVCGLCATVIFLLVAMALTSGRAFKRLYSRLAALTLRNDGLPPPLAR